MHSRCSISGTVGDAGMLWGTVGLVAPPVCAVPGPPLTLTHGNGARGRTLGSPFSDFLLLSLYLWASCLLI